MELYHYMSAYCSIQASNKPPKWSRAKLMWQRPSATLQRRSALQAVGQQADEKLFVAKMTILFDDQQFYSFSPFMIGKLFLRKVKIYRFWLTLGEAI